MRNIKIAQSMKGYNIFVLENIEIVKFCLEKNKSYFNLIISIEKTYYEFQNALFYIVRKDSRMEFV